MRQKLKGALPQGSRGRTGQRRALMVEDLPFGEGVGVVHLLQRVVVVRWGVRPETLQTPARLQTPAGSIQGEAPTVNVSV